MLSFSVKSAASHGIVSWLCVSLLASSWSGSSVHAFSNLGDGAGSDGGTIGGGCPFLKHQQQEQQQQQGDTTSLHRYAIQYRRALDTQTGDGGVPAGGFAMVKQDLQTLMTNSQDNVWPADFGNYAGLFIRLAWHCSGSYRRTDGRGGCDGGRIRFDPELNWPDNANLNHALELLSPIKQKYGSTLSWGDLIILSGNVAIESNGGPILGFCGGRIDDPDGSNSLKLGPSAQQEEIGPCQSLNPSLQGNCQAVNGTALGPTTVGLIYVNPAGPLGFVGDPVASGAEIRKVFGRMGFNDKATVALVGGGHEFGKCHGACTNPPCGNGKGNNTFTSGFEGQWTDTPTKWSNDYFNNLFDYVWTSITGPGGKLQWAPTNKDGTPGPPIMMLTADRAMAEDAGFKPIAQSFATNIAALEEEFKHAWYQLTTADMGPSIRCLGDNIPPPQDFQHDLPVAPTRLPNYIPVRAVIQAILNKDKTSAAAFIDLAYRCAFTFRSTDYQGGCNGARIRLLPESGWPENKGTADALRLLEPVKQKFSSVSYADLIVLAGTTALSSKVNLAFCGGRVDATVVTDGDLLAPRVYSTPYITVKDDFEVKGLSYEMGVALAARKNLSSQYFKDLLAAGSTSSGSFTAYELALLEGNFKAIVEQFAQDESMLLKYFAEAWTYMMTADRYATNRKNSCTGVSTPTLGNPPPTPRVSKPPSPTKSRNLIRHSGTQT